MPLSESSRIDRMDMNTKNMIIDSRHEMAEKVDDDNIDELKQPTKNPFNNKQFDLEVYDDRTFYSHLLKVTSLLLLFFYNFIFFLSGRALYRMPQVIASLLEPQNSKR